MKFRVPNNSCQLTLHDLAKSKCSQRSNSIDLALERSDGHVMEIRWGYPQNSNEGLLLLTILACKIFFFDK